LNLRRGSKEPLFHLTGVRMAWSETTLCKAEPAQVSVFYFAPAKHRSVWKSGHLWLRRGVLVLNCGLQPTAGPKGPDNLFSGRRLLSRQMRLRNCNSRLEVEKPGVQMLQVMALHERTTLCTEFYLFINVRCC